SDPGTGCLTATIGGTVVPGSYPSTTANAKNRVEGAWDPIPGSIGEEIFIFQKTGTFNLPGLSGAADAFVQGHNDIVDNSGPKVFSMGTFSNGTSCPSGPIADPGECSVPQSSATNQPTTTPPRWADYLDSTLNLSASI